MEGRLLSEIVRPYYLRLSDTQVCPLCTNSPGVSIITAFKLCMAQKIFQLFLLLSCIESKANSFSDETLLGHLVEKLDVACRENQFFYFAVTRNPFKN